jgi:hypothetical protein
MNKKTWVLGGVVVLALAGVGGAYLMGLLTAPGSDAMANTDPKAGKAGKDGKKPDVPLEFIPREVVQPALARLPSVMEFSGPLVAPQTALVCLPTSARARSPRSPSAATAAWWRSSIHNRSSRYW